MQISIAICTWNRCQLLRQALEQMTQLAIPRGVNWELLVVNNNSILQRVFAASSSDCAERTGHSLWEERPGAGFTA